jgi:hypothetical protein
MIQANQILELAQAIAASLNEKQEALNACKWADGESNTDTDFSNLACTVASEVWSSDAGITLKATAPDINLTFTFPNGKTQKAKIELKSSKSATMPGSTIGKLDINQPLIYCLRGATYKLRAAQYYLAMGESDYDLFQDRTPRPQINFNKMSAEPAEYVEKEKTAWVEHYAACAVRRTTAAPNKSWQDDLTKAIIDEYLKSTDLATIAARFATLNQNQ